MNVNNLKQFLCVFTLMLYVTVNGDSAGLVSTANNQFTVDLYKQIVGGTKNIISSPFSCSTVLSMLLVGAQSNTADEMKKALEYTSLTQDQINEGYGKIIPALSGDANYTLSIANAIFVNKDYQVSADFENTVKNVYKSDEFALDVTNGKTQINTYVDSKTNHKIPSLLDEELPPATEIVLVNAIYFKGPWKVEFNQTLSTQEPFTNEGGGSSVTTLMHLTSKFVYYYSADLESQFLVLPYKGEAMKMIVILPSDESSLLSQTENLLTGTSIIDAVNKGFIEEVIVTLPKFKIESSFDLVKPLQDLGMQTAYTNTANFGGVSNTRSIKVSKVVQKAFIEVNEEGSEAAAATAVIGVRTTAIGIAPPPPLTFTANRPFLFLLYNQITNSVLFFGKYSNAN